MKTKIITLLLLALSMTVVGQQKKVAVYVSGQQSGITRVLGDQIVAAFAKDGKYIAIERTASFLSELSKEQGYQRTGAVDDNELSRIGKQFGVQLVCVAEIIEEVFDESDNDYKYVTARLIDVETAEILTTANKYSALKSMEDLNEVCSELAKGLTAETAQEKAAREAAEQMEKKKKEEADRIQREKEKIEKKKKDEETKNMLQTALKKGYLKIGNLWVTTKHPLCKEKEAIRKAESAKYNDMGGWRIPTTSELSFVRRQLGSYYDMGLVLGIETWVMFGHSFWEKGSDGKVYGKYKKCYLILVHD